MQLHALGIKLVENGSEDFLRCFAAPLQGMCAIHEHFWLDYGNPKNVAIPCCRFFSPTIATFQPEESRLRPGLQL